MKYLVLGCVAAAAFLIGMPNQVQALEYASDSHDSAEVRIAELRLELVELRARLTTLLRQLYSFYTPYTAIHFTQPVETSYQVALGQLLPAPGKSVRTVDQQLFDLFTKTIGASAIQKHVAEWRVYADTAGTIDAYVEQITGTDRYVVNVNRADFDVSSSLDRESFRDLFIHEYAHLLLITQPRTIDEYDDLFWTDEDRRIAQGSDQARERYFNNEHDRFVSEYALRSVDEDIAEVFLYAIVDPAEVMLGERRKKYEFLADLPGVGVEILRLREELN